MPKDKRKCVDSLRHNEYYDMQGVFDELYNKSIKGSEFHNLMDIILDEDNILLAYLNRTNESYNDGAPCAMKVARTVRSGGKAGDKASLWIALYKQRYFPLNKVVSIISVNN